jgi:hypothetical protein
MPQHSDPSSTVPAGKQAPTLTMLRTPKPLAGRSTTKRQLKANRLGPDLGVAGRNVKPNGQATAGQAGAITLT